MELIEMKLQEIQICEGGSAQIIVLGEALGTRKFPIYIGTTEMTALDHAVHGIPSPRPLTHDLILNVISGMGGALTGVVVDALLNETFFGKLLVRLADGSEVRIDSRPSDAMVLAARKKTPIFVAEEVLRTVDQNSAESGQE